MKKLFFMLTAMFSLSPLNAQQATIASPELTSVLYLGYPNKIVPTVPCGESCTVNIDNGTITPSWFTIDGIQYTGYIVKPNRAGSVTISVSGKDKNGKINKYGDYHYKVKALPKPTINEVNISKTSGVTLSVGLGDSPLNVDFTIKGGEIIIGDDSFKFEGNVISVSLLDKIAVGKSVVVEVAYQTNGSGGLNVISSAMVVVP